MVDPPLDLEQDYIGDDPAFTLYGSPHFERTRSNAPAQVRLIDRTASEGRSTELHKLELDKLKSDQRLWSVRNIVGACERRRYGFQPLVLSSSLAFFTKVKSKMSLILISRCTLVVFFISSIMDCKTLSSVKPSRKTSFDWMS